MIRQGRSGPARLARDPRVGHGRAIINHHVDAVEVHHRALALGAGTQVFTLGVGNAVFGISELTTALGLGAGWAINLAVVEYVIRRRITTRRAGRATRVAAAA